MLSKRLLVIAADPKLGRKLIVPLTACGATVTHETSAGSLPSGALDVDLVVLVLGRGDPAEVSGIAERLPDHARIVAVVAASDLRRFVGLFSHPVVHSVIVADLADTALFAGVASRLLYGDIFGADKILPWGVRTYSRLVAGYQEKAVAIATVGDFAQALGVRRKHREVIEQVVDELLMNALYDAPVDAHGQPLYTSIPTKERITVKVEQPAVLEYGSDGERFVIGVRDSYGRLTRQTVLNYLHKCLHSSEQIDRKAGGAGLGLYLIASQVTDLYFNLAPGTATEVLASFDLRAPKATLRELGFFSERIDATGRLAAARLTAGGVGTSSRRLPAVTAVPVGASAPESRPAGAGAGGATLTWALGLAVLVLTGAVAMLAWPQLAGGTAEGSLEVRTRPAGAEIFLDGVKRGVTQGGRLVLDRIAAGTSHSVRARLAGFGESTALVVVTPRQRAHVELQLFERQAPVNVTSTPPGARVLVGGKATGLITPAQLDLPPDRPAEVTLALDGYTEAKLQIRPKAGEPSRLHANLTLAPGFGLISIESEPPGAEVSLGDFPLGQTTPVRDYVVRSGRRYRVTVRKPGFVPFSQEVKVGAGERIPIKAVLKVGGALSVSANYPVHVFVDNVDRGAAPLGELALPPGQHTVSLRGNQPYIRETFTVNIEPGKTEQRMVKLGLVDAGPGKLVLLKQAAGDVARGRQRVALPVGKRTITLMDQATQQIESRQVTVVEGKVTPVTR